MAKIDEIEEQYQSEKVLSTGSEAQGEVTDVGWELQIPGEPFSTVIYLDVDITGGSNYSISVKPSFDPFTENGIVHLFEIFSERPRPELNILRGKSFDASISELDGDKALDVRSNGSRVTGVINEDSNMDVSELPETLPEEILYGINRAFIYSKNGCKTTPLEVPEIRHEEGDLIAKLSHGCGQIFVPTETTASLQPETRYERLVEYVGEGSVKQIQKSEVYLSHETDIKLLDDIADEATRQELKDKAPDIFEDEFPESDEEFLVNSMEDFIMLDSTSTGRWAITATSTNDDQNSIPYAIIFISSALLGIYGILSGNMVLLSFIAIITLGTAFLMNG